jgi:hypothetical protein
MTVAGRLEGSATASVASARANGIRAGPATASAARFRSTVTA